MAERMEIKELRLVWPADSGPAIFANNATVQSDVDGIVYLTFYQAMPPTLVGSPDEQSRQIESLETIEAKPIVKLALTKSHLQRLVDLLQAHRDKLES